VPVVKGIVVQSFVAGRIAAYPSALAVLAGSVSYFFLAPDVPPASDVLVNVSLPAGFTVNGQSVARVALPAGSALPVRVVVSSDQSPRPLGQIQVGPAERCVVLCTCTRSKTRTHTRTHTTHPQSRLRL
jgi:hypothetical protein